MLVNLQSLVEQRLEVSNVSIILTGEQVSAKTRFDEKPRMSKRAQTMFHFRIKFTVQQCTGVQTAGYLHSRQTLLVRSIVWNTTRGSF